MRKEEEGNQLPRQFCILLARAIPLSVPEEVSEQRQVILLQWNITNTRGS